MENNRLHLWNTYKFSIFGIFLLMGLTIITGMAVYGVMRQQIELSLGRGLGVALQGEGHLLESQIEKSLAKTEAFAISPFLIQSMQQLSLDSTDNQALSDVQTNVLSLKKAGFSAAIVYDLKGIKLSQIGQLADKQSQSLQLNKYQDTYLIWDNQLILHTRKDVFDQNDQRVGSIVTESVLPRLTRSLGEIRSIGNTGAFIMCSPSPAGEKKMACLISTIDGIRFKSLIRETDGDVLPMNYALNGETGIVEVKDYHQVPVIEAYAPLQTIGLGMVLKLDQDELFKPVSEKLRVVVLYLSGLIIAEIVLLNWFFRKLIISERNTHDAKEKAVRFSNELSRKEIELRERLKEITCLYNIRQSIGSENALDDICQQIFRHLIPAMQYPDDASVVIEIDGNQLSSINHDQNQVCELRSDIFVNGKTCGHLSVFYPEDKTFLVLEEQRLIDAITGELTKWLERKQVDEILQIRLKEMTCLYEIRRGMSLDLSVDDICSNIIEQLVPAMQFPEITSIEIEIDKKIYKSGTNHSCHTSKHDLFKDDKVCYGCYRYGAIVGSMLQSEITVNERACGLIRVSYPENMPFLVIEERKLVDAIAVDLSRWLERKQIDNLLHERLKEMSCLYEIRRSMGIEMSLDNVCRNIFKHLIPAMRFPEIVSAVIELDGWRYTSGKYTHGFVSPILSKIYVADEVRGPWRMKRDPACTSFAAINVNGEVCGQLRVYYPVDQPFLVQEEKKLINAIAGDLEIWIERKRLEEALVFVAEEQANNIGQELHDNLGQQVAAMSYQAGALEKKILAMGDGTMASVAASIATQAQAAVKQIKQLAQGLLPFELETNGLVVALKKLASRLASSYMIECDFVYENEEEINDKNITLNLYRIVQEAANNAIRHGKAQHITISLTLQDGLLTLSICDDGCGFKAETNQTETQGMGLKIMLYRAKQLGAKIKFLSRDEGGTEVFLKMQII